MKIRKAYIGTEIYPVYIHENKKEEHTLVAIPSLSWSTIITYEEAKANIEKRLINDFALKLTEEAPEHLSLKIVQWVTEM